MSPYDILCVSPDADDDAIREAYLTAIRRHPPTHNPATFSRIAEAYKKITTEEDRLQHAALGSAITIPGGPLAQVACYARMRRPRPDASRLLKSIPHILSAK